MAAAARYTCSLSSALSPTRRAAAGVADVGASRRAARTGPTPIAVTATRTSPPISRFGPPISRFGPPISRFGMSRMASLLFVFAVVYFTRISPRMDWCRLQKYG